MKVRDVYAYQLFTCKDQYSILHLSSRLFQQWCVEMYVKIELQHLRFIELHQATLRSDLYRGLIDAVLHDGNLGEIGRFVLLLLSFTRGERYIRKQYYDSIAIEAILQGQRSPHRPDLVTRAFKLKLDAIKDVIVKNKIFGKVRALTYVIEFQKRGRPRAHMTIKLTDESSPKRPEDYDKFVCAELPDPNLHTHLYEMISNNMMHGPCDVLNPKAPCMKDGVCSKGYPGNFRSDTICDDRGYAGYRRRDQGITTLRKNVELDNRCVVPYNAYQCEKYNCHINVDICSTIAAIKYMYEYMCKGPDRATISMWVMVVDVDEVNDYLTGRDICPPEAC
ncbi:Helitron helicase [Phytophthora megakarya]|uniref:Helitron helicase n=1 Tax=Phytophthora megakarya TaxID=4795 RepID=A0A225VCI5_9STRA|nr:Helitron helicase [Phytophthora megakarya]